MLADRMRSAALPNVTPYRGLYLSMAHGGAGNLALAELVFTLRAGGDVAGGTGSAIGNMTAGGGLAAAFDGTTSQTFAACARLASNTGATLGKDWGSGNSFNIQTLTIYEPSDAKVDGGAPTEDMDVALYGTTDGTASGGTLIRTWEDVWNGIAGGVYGSGRILNIDTGAISAV